MALDREPHHHPSDIVVPEKSKHIFYGSDQDKEFIFAGVAKKLDKESGLRTAK